MAEYKAADFLATVGASESTRTHYAKALSAMEGWAGSRLGSLSLTKLETLMKKLRSMSSGPHYAVILRMFYARAGMEDHRKRAVLKQRLKRLRPEDILSVGEVQRCIDATTNTRDRAFIAALYETGVRVSELCALTWDDLREKPENGGPAGYVLWFGRTKIAGEEHQGFIFEGRPVLEAWLKAHPNPGGKAALFPTWGGRHLSREGAWSIVEAAAARAKIGKRVYPHLFRHSRATHLLQRGATEAEVKKLLGWAPGSLMLNRYAHLTDDDAERAALRAGGFALPEKVDLGKLDFADEKLRPVIPVSRPPGVAPSLQGELDKLPADKLREFGEILIRLAAAKENSTDP